MSSDDEDFGDDASVGGSDFDDEPKAKKAVPKKAATPKAKPKAKAISDDDKPAPKKKAAPKKKMKDSDDEEDEEDDDGMDFEDELQVVAPKAKGSTKEKARSLHMICIYILSLFRWSSLSVELRLSFEFRRRIPASPCPPPLRLPLLCALSVPVLK